MTNNIEVTSRYVLPNTGYFEINNGKSVYRLMEKMTSIMTQDKLAEFYEIEKQKGNPIPMNSIQHFGLFNDAVKSRNPDLLNFLQKGLQEYPNTLTRVIYNPVGKEDETIHNYSTSDAYSIIGNIVGQDGLIKNIPDKKVLESLLGTSDVSEIDLIAQKINKTGFSLWRFNKKQSKKIERVVRFDANPDGFYLDAVRVPLVEGPAFLVLPVDKNK